VDELGAAVQDQLATLVGHPHRGHQLLDDLVDAGPRQGQLVATSVMQEFRDIVLAYGQSDEYSFVFRKETAAFKRRSAKLLTYVTSLFSTSYVMQWSKWMNIPLAYAPCFDGRVVLYPSTFYCSKYNLLNAPS